MNEQAIPESRNYRHVKCGEETEVAGQPFELVSNPMSSMEQTFCSSCNAMFPMSDYEWVDTDEKISDYYARHTQNATDAQRFLCSKKFMGMLILGLAVAAAVGLSILTLNSGTGAKIGAGLGGLIVGAIAGMIIFVSGFANPIKKKVCGVSDTRLLR